VSDIDTVVVDSLKALDPEWPIREADMAAPFIYEYTPFCNGGIVTCRVALTATSSPYAAR
jgi:hypothetical protein